MNLIMNEDAHYDEAVALVLCQMQKFKAGQIYLYEKMTLYNEILVYYMENKEYANILKYCMKFAKTQDPNLWIRVLTYFAEIDPSIYDPKSEIIEILKKY